MLPSLTYFFFALRNTTADSRSGCGGEVPCEILTIITAVHKCVSITPADVLEATFGHLPLVQSLRALKPLHLPTPSARSQATVTAQEIPGTSISLHRQTVDPHLPCDCLLTISMNNTEMVRSLCPAKKQVLYIMAATMDGGKDTLAAHFRTSRLFSFHCQLAYKQ